MRVDRRFNQQDWMLVLKVVIRFICEEISLYFFGSGFQTSKYVFPDGFHIGPVLHDAVTHGVFQFKQSSEFFLLSRGYSLISVRIPVVTVSSPIYISASEVVGITFLYLGLPILFHRCY